jgi:DNA-binding NarL/FixJ family response regulator
VLRLVARGLSNAEVAAELLVISELQKLDLRNRIHAVVLAYETGIVQPGGNAALAGPS